MIVAVASPLSPPQHCPMFGQRASSHTVCKLSPRRSFLILLYEAEIGTLVLRYFGRRSLRQCCQCTSIRAWSSAYVAVLPNWTRCCLPEAVSKASPEMKSSKSGPLLSFSCNVCLLALANDGPAAAAEADAAEESPR